MESNRFYEVKENGMSGNEFKDLLNQVNEDGPMDDIDRKIDSILDPSDVDTVRKVVAKTFEDGRRNGVPHGRMRDYFEALFQEMLEYES
jgi:hypothetical protein